MGGAESDADDSFEDATRCGAVEDDVKDALAPETPERRSSASVSERGSESGTEATDVSVGDGAEAEADGGSSSRDLRETFESAAVEEGEGVSRDDGVLGAEIFDFPGDGALSLDELSRGGFATGRLSPESLAYGRGGDVPAGVSIRGVIIKDAHVNHRLLEVAAMRLPREGSTDGAWRLSGERAKRARSRCSKTPRSYPTRSPPGLDSPLLFKRLDADALFFTFYFSPTPRHKLLAAQELRESNWRLHKHLNAWFARLEQPKLINEAEKYERGAVIYFDHNMQVNEADSSTNGWCQRSRADFVSRYDDFV